MPRTKPLGWGSPGPRPARPPPRSQDKGFNPSHAFLAFMGTPSGEQPLPGGRGTPPPLPLRRPSRQHKRPPRPRQTPMTQHGPSAPRPTAATPGTPTGGAQQTGTRLRRSVSPAKPASRRPLDAATCRTHHLGLTHTATSASSAFSLPLHPSASRQTQGGNSSAPAKLLRGEGRGLACRGGAAPAPRGWRSMAGCSVFGGARG